MVDKVKQGKRNRISGAAFELRVRKDMIEKGWVVDKFGLNVELADTTNIDIPGELDIVKDCGKLIQAKNKWAGPGRPMMMGAGFPDFVCSRWNGEMRPYDMYNIIGLECKANGYLDKTEREKCRWLLDNNTFSEILIAEKTKVKNRIVIVYHDFEEKYGNNA